jgi:hypothetical protein
MSPTYVQFNGASFSNGFSYKIILEAAGPCRLEMLPFS